jgi:hypothetical protein
MHHLRAMGNNLFSHAARAPQHSTMMSATCGVRNRDEGRQVTEYFASVWTWSVLIGSGRVSDRIDR